MGIHALIGSYTQPGQGQGAGISRVELTGQGLLGPVVRQTSILRNPSFLAAGASAVYAVEELANGQLVALNPETLEPIWRTPTLGSDPCHVLALESRVLAANYSSGNVAVVELDAGDVGETYVLEHQGSGPILDRQEASHAHQVTATAWGTILVSDLGADRVDEYRMTATGTYDLWRSADLPPGSGPRHVALAGENLLVAGELDGRLHVLALEDELWIWQLAVPMFDAANPELDAAAEVWPSHIQLSADGGLLYAAVRGRNSLVVFDVSALPDAPQLLCEVASGGDWPRHFALSTVAAGTEATGTDTAAAAAAGTGITGKIYVANERSHQVSVFDLDASGLPGPTPVQSFALNSPTCVVLAGTA